MSDKKDDGGPAFPFNVTTVDETYSGMTLRDYFAAKAMNGLLSGGDMASFRFTGDTTLAELSYKMADAMLAARKL